MKKMTVIGLIVVGVVTIGCATLYESENNSNPPKNTANIDKWKKQAPQLFNNAGYAKLEESIPQPVNQSESMAQLMGTITNPFGIRDDILEFIIKTIPANNESANRAAIKMMQYSQQIYYGNLSQPEALLISNKYVLADDCLRTYLKQDVNYQSNNDPIKIVKYTSSLREMMSDNKNRTNHVNDTDRKYFSWQVIGTGLSTYEEAIACQKGEF